MGTSTAGRASAPVLGVRLLGGFDLRAGDRPVALDSARAESFLAYLVLHRDAPQPRQKIAFALWPDSTGAQARTNLRHVVHNLGRSWPERDRYLEVTPRTLHWSPREPWWLDVAAFDEAVSRAEDGTTADAIAALRDAVEHYRGDLLAGRDEEWLDGERQRLRTRFGTALHRLATTLESRGRHRDAIRYAERLLREDPLAEQTYLLLMRLYGAAGDRARALRAYHACAATLERELGVQPSPALRRRYEALLAAPDARAAGEAPEAGQAPVGGQARAAGEARAGAGVPAADPPRAAGGRPPLVGRVAERRRLVAAWESAADRYPRLVLVTGEAGIGKTRLVDDFRSWCAHRGAVTAAAGAYPAEGALAYGLVVSWLRAEGIAGPLRLLPAPRLTELARLLPELLVERPDLAAPPDVAAHDLRHRLFDAVASALHSTGAPVLLIADDLHWADPESLRFLHYLLRTRPPSPLLVAATVRHEDVPDGHALPGTVAALQVHDRVVDVPLDRFSSAETAVLAHRLTGAELDEAARTRLYEATEGNPLFVVEALRAGWRADRPVPGGLGPRVQAVIRSRLAELSPLARDLLGVAATIGRDFTADVLAEAGGVADEDLVRGLDELWRRRIVREHGVDAYDFSHGKIRDVVYDSLDPARRRHHHRCVAAALRRRHAAEPGPVSGRLALHHERAGETDEAVTWYGRAADAALRLHAYGEALRQLDRALHLLRTLPPGPARDTRELALLEAMAAPLATAESYASPRLAAAHERALHLSGELGQPPAPPLLRGMAVASLSRGDFAAANRLAARLRALGSRSSDPVLAAEAEYVHGIAEFWRGRFPSARSHFEAAVARYQPEHRHTHLIRYGLDPRAICMSRLANTWWFLARREAAVRARRTALAWVDEAGHPASRSTALVFAALLSLELRDPAGVRDHTARLMAVAGAEGEPKVTGQTTEALAGYVDVLDGRTRAGLARIERELSAVQAVEPAPGARATLRRILLAAYTAAGDAAGGLAAADAALTATDGVATWESEFQRQRAEFAAALSAPDAEVAAGLEHALATARRQHAALFELRAATALLRLAGPDDAAARDRLAGLVARLGAARGTPDFDDAVAMLGAERSRNAPSGMV